MRNLETSRVFSMPPCFFLKTPKLMTVDVDTGDVWIVDNNGLFLVTTNTEGKRTIEPVVSLVDCGVITGGADFVGLQHVPDVEMVYIAASTGEVLTYSTSANEVDCAGTLDSGITCMAWSPDQEVAVFTSGEGKLVLMNKDLNPVAEVDMHPTEFGESEPITVGWGKKETQFHGTLGKHSANEKKEETLPCFPWDDQKVRVSWRGDGQFFAVSSISPTRGRRLIRVWTRQCTLHSTSEDVIGTEQALGWRPVGNLIATSQRKPNKHDIVFFEPNGLKRGEFSLPFNRMEMKVKEVQWNADSSVLAVVLVNLTRGELEAFNHQCGASEPRAPVPDSIANKCRVQLWCVNNFHWYLKQELRFDAVSNGSRDARDGGTDVAAVQWDPILPFKLHILTTDGAYCLLEYRWAVARSSCSAHSAASVAVVDGDRLLVTPFRTCMVPPPMSAYHLVLPAPVAMVTFGPPAAAPDSLLVLTADGCVSLYSQAGTREGASELMKIQGQTGTSGLKVGQAEQKVEQAEQKVEQAEQKVEQAGSKAGNERDGEGFRVVAGQPVLTASGQLLGSLRPSGKEGEGEGEDCFPVAARHLCWSSLTALLCVVWDRETLCDSVLVFSFEVEEDSDSGDQEKGRDGGAKCGKLAFTQKKSFRCEHSVISMVTNPHTSTVAVQFEDGSVSRLDCDLGFGSWFENPPLPLAFPHPCSLVELGSFGEEEVVVGLTERHRLFFNDKEVAADCLSFCFHDDFFLFTTHSHTCRVISLRCPVKDIPFMSGEKSANCDESLRRVERGSKIVTAIAGETKLVLQMPRGNLETINPRALVLSCVRKGLDRLEYRKVFQLMRRHRINMNIVVDHNPQAFFASIGLFVSELDDTTAINLFLTELREENVTETMYKGISTGFVPPPPLVGIVATAGSEKTGSKVDLVCDAMIEELTKQDQHRFLLSIITAHVKKSEPEIESALLKIKAIKDNPPKQESGTLTAADALKYLLYLVDVNKLYNLALGMYDFSLVLFVAEKSQKDPKEYLPYLNQLQKMEPSYMRYSVDLSLGRHRSALVHITACGGERFEECLALVKKHSLYPNALTLLQDRRDHYNEVSRAFGDHLLEKKKYEEAGLVLMRAGYHSEAKDAFEKGLHWQKVFVLLSQMSANEAVVMETARKMAASLRSAQRFSEAARVLLDYAEGEGGGGGSTEEAAALLLEDARWSEALRLMHLSRRLDLVASLLVPALRTAAERSEELLAALRSQLTQQTQRLLVVREEKRLKQMESLLDEGGDEAGNDLYSDTTSLTGTSTRSTNISNTSSSRTAKSRRKLDRKKYSLKEGSRLEDVALMHALAEALTSLDQQQDDVKTLIAHLTLFGCEREAAELQETFGSVLQLAAEKLPLVWPSDLQTAPSEDRRSPSGPQTFGPHATVNSILATDAKGDSKMTAIGNAEDLQRREAELPKKPTLRQNVSWRSNLFVAT